MFVAADGAMTRLLGIGGRSLSNAMVCVASLATIPVGHAVSAAAQVAILCATLATATAARSRGSEPTLVLRLRACVSASTEGVRPVRIRLNKPNPAP